MGTAAWEAAAMAAVTSWEVEKPKLGAARWGRVEGSGLRDSPQQGREVKRALERPVTGRQAGLLCERVPAWVVPRSQTLIADGAASQASAPSPHPCPPPCPRSGSGCFPPRGDTTPSSWAGLPCTKWLPPSSPASPSSPSPKLSCSGVRRRAVLVSVVPGCQRLYISALLMLILCNHFLLQNLLAAR